MSTLQRFAEYQQLRNTDKQQQSYGIMSKFHDLLPEQLQDLFVYGDPFIGNDFVDFVVRVDNVELMVNYNSWSRSYTVTDTKEPEDGKRYFVWKTPESIDTLIDYIMTSLIPC